MSRLAEIQVVSNLFAIKASLLLAFVRPSRFRWFPRKQSSRRSDRGPTPAELVALADIAMAEGRSDDAKCLLEAAYILYDRDL